MEETMKRKTDNSVSFPIVSPMSGKLVPLEEVPDAVFSEKILGDGIAVMPETGKITSPVNGTIISVAETLHAYNIESDDGLKILIHVGLETVGLKGEGFSVKVKEGDKVRVGDVIGGVDLSLLKSKNINPITSVILCDVPDNTQIKHKEGSVIAGKSIAFDVIDSLSENIDANITKGDIKNNSAFDFLQKLGKVLMVVIAVMPAAGIMISIGKLIAMAGIDNSFINTVSLIMENIGWAIIGNLNIL